MVIDIVDLNDPQFADMSSVQLSMVRAAQAEKDEILSKAAKEKSDCLMKLLDRNMARSSAYGSFCLSADAEAAQKVEAVRDDLLYRLAYEQNFSGGNESGPYRYPENPNFNLAYPQRFLAVRDYYMHVTGDAKARLEAFGMDSLARSYLGEYYQTLYDLLASYVS